MLWCWNSLSHASWACKIWLIRLHGGKLSCLLGSVLSDLRTIETCPLPPCSRLTWLKFHLEVVHLYWNMELNCLFDPQSGLSYTDECCSSWGQKFQIAYPILHKIMHAHSIQEQKHSTKGGNKSLLDLSWLRLFWEREKHNLSPCITKFN